MSPDDPIYDPVRQIADATRAMVAINARLGANLARLSTTSQHTQDLIQSALRVERALGWAVIFGVLVLLVVLVVLAWHVL